MTVQSQTSRADYSGNGATTLFAVPFYFLLATDLQVIRTDTSTSPVTVVTLVLNTDYTVAGVANPAGGSITTTLAPTASQRLSILRNVPYTQLKHYVPNDPFPAASHEMGLDKLTMEVQQLAEVQGRALTLAPNTTGVSTTLPVPATNQLIGWNQAATALQNVDPATLATVVAYGTANADKFSGTGVLTAFTLSANPGALNNLDVAIAGVTQRPGIDFTWNGGLTLTFTTAPPVGVNNVLARYMQGLPQGYSDSAATTFVQAGVGAVTRTVQDRLRDSVNVKDFGAVGTANIANQVSDTAAFLAALATGKNVLVPEGTFYLSQTVSVGYGQRLFGSGQYKTVLVCSGDGPAVYMGNAVLTSLYYNIELTDLTIYCTSRAATVNGVELQNCVYFLLRNLSIFGSGSPNSPTPADRVLYGSGVYLHDNTIIGQLDHVSCRLWNIGRRYATDAGNQSRWTAAIVDHGQGELANVMRGVVIGDATVALYSGVGLTLQNLTFQGCYTTGINVNGGDSTIIEGCYFEGNANYDIAVGTPSGAPAPIGVKISKNSMSAENIGTTPYGTFPYLAKIYVDRGVFTTIRDNNLSISTAIPLITLTSLSDTANISGNRLNSTIAAASRISDGSATTITNDNYPEKPRFATGSIARQLNAASASVAYTGLGFRPTNIEFYASVDGVNERCLGSVGVGVGLQSRCMTTDSSGANFSSTDAVRIIRSSAGNEQKATLASFDADGFTLNWTLLGAPPANSLVVNYIARR